MVACFFYIECLVATRHCTGTEVINKRLANVVLELIVPILRCLDSKGLPSGVGRIVEKERIVAQDADISGTMQFSKTGASMSKASSSTIKLMGADDHL